MNLEKLRAQRENLKSKLSEVDAKIGKVEREAREREARELVKLIQSRGITAAQLSAMLGEQGNA